MQALLAYLLLHLESPQPRQQLASLFLPDTSESQARTNLRQLLHYLHKALPDSDQFLQIESKTVQWRPDADFTLDMKDFNRYLIEATAAMNEGRVESEHLTLESAIKHYNGDLLPYCYDDWIFPEREHLRQAKSGHWSTLFSWKSNEIIPQRSSTPDADSVRILCAKLSICQQRW